MRLQDITQENISQLTNKELTSLHWRIHQLWSFRKSKNINRSLLSQAHSILIHEMGRRGLKHIEHAMKRVISKLNEYLGDIT